MYLDYGHCMILATFKFGFVISQKLNRLSKQNYVITLEIQLERLKLQLNDSNKSKLEIENIIKEY